MSICSAIPSKIKKIQNLKLVDGLLHIVYPAHCLVCERELVRSESTVCNFCLEELHFTHFEKYTDATDLDKLFWGRLPLSFSYALLFYEKSNSSKNLLRALKYKHRKDVGLYFGKLIGEKLLDHPAFSTIDALVPVPIHPKKKFIRGYNQSKILAQGIEHVSSIPVMDFLQRSENSSSQTKLGRFGRWDNVSNKFRLQQPPKKIKHIAIVDDVVTTGATLESILSEIHRLYPEIQLSVISLALAK